jgi:alpha-glucosidase
LDYPDEEKAAAIDDEFLFGSDLLVAPILTEGATERDIYLPKGDWYDYWTGRKYSGGGSIHISAALDTLPLFIRGGAFLFQQPVVQHTGEMSGKPLRILVTPATESESTLYEDDGESFKYREGIFLKRQFHQVSNTLSTTIDVSGPEGAYRPAERDLVLEAWTGREPQAVSMAFLSASKNPNSLPHLTTVELAQSHAGWSYEDGKLTVKARDSFVPVQIVIRRQ